MSTHEKRAVIFTDLPADFNIQGFRYELEQFGEIQLLDLPKGKDGKWDRTCIVSYHYDTDNEKLLCVVPKIVYCGIHLKARFTYLNS